MSRHANISIFVPHYGCPNRCSFCNQYMITGENKMPTGEDVKAAVETAVASGFGGAEKKEIAFFGGSFTAIDRRKMIELLDAAYIYVADGTVDGIRISTRPDCINLEILYELKIRGVTAIELGAQSMDDSVLMMNHRGHLAEHVIHAAQLIKSYQIELGLQMMTGLPGDDDEKAVLTAHSLAALEPATVRIYPLIILPGTEIASMYRSGTFKPQSLNDAVKLCSKLLLFFEEKGIKVIRLGLHELNKDEVIAGPWHPAFSELCENKIYLDKLKNLLESKPDGEYNLAVARGEMSKAVGQKKSNIAALMQINKKVKIIEDAALSPRDIVIV